MSSAKYLAFDCCFSMAFAENRPIEFGGPIAGTTGPSWWSSLLAGWKSSQGDRDLKLPIYAQETDEVSNPDRGRAAPTEASVEADRHQCTPSRSTYRIVRKLHINAKFIRRSVSPSPNSRRTHCSPIYCRKRRSSSSNMARLQAGGTVWRSQGQTRRSAHRNLGQERQGGCPQRGTQKPAPFAWAITILQLKGCSCGGQPPMIDIPAIIDNRAFPISLNDLRTMPKPT